jgi:hypothetical protein
MAQPRLTAEEAAEKHATRLKASISDITAGVNRVTVAPTKQAAAKQDKMLQNLTKAVTGGKWASGLNRVSLEEWKAKTITLGTARIAQGIDEAHDKQVKFFDDLFKTEATVMTKVSAMPDLTLEDSINRCRVWMTEMSKFKRS